MGHPRQSPNTTASMRSIGLLAAVIVTAAGCGSPAGHGHPALTAGATAAVWPDPCTEMPAADVVRLDGRDMAAPQMPVAAMRVREIPDSPWGGRDRAI